MTNNELEARISRAMDSLVPPDTFEKIAARVAPASREEGRIVSMTVIKTRKIRRFIVPAVAACVILLVGVFGTVHYQNHYAVDSVIDIDVNPSIEIKTNKADRVLSVTAVNKDGTDILDGMDLGKTELKVAVNAIVGSMVQKGYVLSEDNAILVSVQNKDTSKAVRIRSEIAADIDSSLAEHKINAPIINQTVTDFDNVKQFANEHGISYGKAAFVLGLAEKESSLDAATLADYQLPALVSVVTDKDIDIRDIVDYDADDTIWENIADTLDEDVENAGESVGKTLITPHQAKQIALDGFSVDAKNATFIKVELDRDDNIPVYEIEFVANGAVYEYEINAIDGSVLDRDVDRDDVPRSTTRSTTTADAATSKATTTVRNNPTGPATALIGKERAKEIALNHAGVKAADATFVKVEVGSDDGVAEYEVDFRADGIEYEYEIRAKDGKVLSAERDAENDEDDRPRSTTTDAPASSSAKPSTTTTAERISAERAKEIVLAHAEVNADNARFEKVELDKDDGVFVYEIEFQTADSEYEYEIRAKDGKILAAERDDRD